MRKQFDNLWKGVIEDLFIDFLRFMDAGADAILDFEKGIQFLDKELEQTYRPDNSSYSPKIVDKLARVFTREGEEEWILVHIEIQDQYRGDFGKRMFKYYYRLFDKHDKPITAYAIFIEPNLTERPDIFEKGFMGTNLRYQFNTLKIANQDDDALFASDNPFALAVLIAKSSLLVAKIKGKEQHDKDLLLYKRRLARELLSRKMSKNKILALMHFLQFYVIFENEELNVTFDSEAKLLIDKNDKNMGIHEQLLEYFKGEGLTSGLIPGLEENSKKAFAEGQAIRITKFLDAARAKGMAGEGEFDMAVLLAEEKARHIAEQEMAIRLAAEKAKGIAEAKEMEVRNLITKHGFSDQQIMDFAEVSISYVKRIRNILLSMN